MYSVSEAFFKRILNVPSANCMSLPRSVYWAEQLSLKYVKERLIYMRFMILYS